jgi:hypothetical protein
MKIKTVLILLFLSLAVSLSLQSQTVTNTSSDLANSNRNDWTPAEISGRLIVKGYRKIAVQHGCAPTAKTTDLKIIEIYTLVTTAFQQAAKQRGEQIPALFDNHISAFF